MHYSANRRKFLKGAAATSVGFWVAGRATWADELAGTSANEKINFASIGIGGKGDSDSEEVARHGNLVAICDIDDKRLDSKGNRHPKARRFNDFREMFDKMGKEIDAVTISTPDHTHAAATMMAIKLGKHVYTQKPMTHDVWEARQLRLAAREYKVATQMGNQGTATDKLRAGVEVLRAGAIGAIKEVHVWTNRPVWPQSPIITARPPEAPVPAYVHWDQWLGTAPQRPYADNYLPFKWRGWRDFGTGALGDMGCHTTNLPFMALHLGYPDSIVAESEEPNPETYPGWARVTFEFPAREVPIDPTHPAPHVVLEFAGRQTLPPVKLIWYEGHKDGKLVLPPDDLVEKVVTEYNKILVRRGDRRVKDGKKVGLDDSGSIAVGEKGIFYSPTDDGKDWELLPADDFRDYQAPAPSLPRNPLGGEFKTMDEGHKVDWIVAMKGGPKALSNFDYAGLLTESILLGNVAIREGGTKLQWDGANMKFPNAPQAEKWLKREYRKPWSL